MIEGLVSTIIPVYNRSAMLQEAVDSVLAQTWRPIEIIIVDDGSDDDTPQVADGLQAHYPDIIRVMHQTNSGPGAARQAGLELAKGEFIQFLDSDDLLLPNKFELQIHGLISDSEAGISYGKTYTQENGVRLSSPAQHTGEQYRTLLPALLKGPLWPTLTPLYRRTTVGKVGRWPAKKQLEDWIYDAQAAALGVKLHYCDQYIAETRNHHEGRLCHLWVNNTDAMRDRITAYVKILEYAQQAGVAKESPEMQQFARSLFWMARNAGSYGLPDEAQHLFDLSRSIAMNVGWDYRLFSIATTLLGWQRACQLAEKLKGLHK